MSPTPPASMVTRGDVLYAQWWARNAHGTDEPLARAFCTQKLTPAMSIALGCARQSIKDTAALAHLLESELLAPMLLWSSRQVWAQDIDRDRVVSNWHAVIANDPRGAFGHAQQANAAIACSSELYHRFEHEACERMMLDAWLAPNLDGVWQGTHHPDVCTAALYTAWLHVLGMALDQHLIPSSERASDNEPHPTWGSHRDLEWNRLVGSALNTRLSEQQQRYMLVVLSSDCSVSAKVQACRLVHAQQWLDPAMKAALLDALPLSQEERLVQLHWFGKDRSKGDAYVAQKNQELVAIYCPEVAPLVTALATPAHWTSASGMAMLSRTIAAAAHAGAHAPQLGLPMGCFEPEDASSSS